MLIREHLTQLATNLCNHDDNLRAAAATGDHVIYDQAEAARLGAITCAVISLLEGLAAQQGEVRVGSQ